MDDLNFAQNITALRRRHGITQEALADFIGVTKAAVSKWAEFSRYSNFTFVSYLL